MIKPNTLCMVRGVPRNYPGNEFNGVIVSAVQIKRVTEQGNVWTISPELKDAQGNYYTGCAERWLHPLDDFEDELTREALDEVLERTFCETLERELEKLK